MSSNFKRRYDQYMGRWSKRLAPLFLDFAGATDGEHIIDVGCGTAVAGLGGCPYAKGKRSWKSLGVVDYLQAMQTNRKKQAKGAP